MEVTARREHLPDLDERGPELFERDTQISWSHAVGFVGDARVQWHPVEAQRSSQLRQPLLDQHLGDVALTRAQVLHPVRRVAGLGMDRNAGEARDQPRG